MHCLRELGSEAAQRITASGCCEKPMWCFCVKYLSGNNRQGKQGQHCADLITHFKPSRGLASSPQHGRLADVPTSATVTLMHTDGSQMMDKRSPNDGCRHTDHEDRWLH